MSDFIAGAAVGFSQVAVGHPFDTAKVLAQNSKTWWGLPLKNYYRGWKFPLISATIFNCTVFPIYERTMKYTENSWISGYLAGIAVSPLIFLFDVGKINQQTNQKIKLNKFIYSYGKYTTFIRETTAMSLYFGTYFNLREKAVPPLIAGGLAGLANWTFTYPIDVVRSRQIAQNISLKTALYQGKLWKGYPICASRAVIVNGVNFWVYETVKKYL